MSSPKSKLVAESPPTYSKIADIPNEDKEAADNDGVALQDDGFFGKIKQARQTSKCLDEFVKSFISIITNTTAWTICLVIALIFPIASIIVGAKYHGADLCRVEPKISIYLIVLGCFGLFRDVISLCKHLKFYRLFNKTEAANERDSKRNGLRCLIDCFLFAWFICGNVWIYSNYLPNFSNAASSDYCHKTLYLYAFWITTLTYIMVGVFILSMCCLACSFFATRYSKQQSCCNSTD